MKSGSFFGAYIDFNVSGFSFFCSYALDVNTERAEDVLVHKKLLETARDPLTRPAVDVRLVQVCLEFVMILELYIRVLSAAHLCNGKGN